MEYLFPYEYPAEVVAERLETAGLVQAVFNIPPGDWVASERGMAALPERKADFAKSLDVAIDYAKVIGSPLLHMMACKQSAPRRA